MTNVPIGLERWTQRVFVVDTNVLLHDAQCIHNFAEHAVVISNVVLQELDRLKKGRDTGFDAREAIGAINRVLDAHSSNPRQMLNEGAQTAGGGRLFMLNGERIGTKEGDDLLLEVCQQLNGHGLNVTLVTKDVNLRLRAIASHTNTEDYRNDKAIDDLALLPSGMTEISVSLSDYLVDSKRGRDGTCVVSDAITFDAGVGARGFMLDSDGLYWHRMANDEAGANQVKCLGYHDELMTRYTVYGLKPRNIQQALAIHLLLDESCSLVALNGPAGSGKTLLTFAAAMEFQLEKKPRRYKRIIYTRLTVDMGEEIGFLPGTEEEKMQPWLQAVNDAVEVLHDNEQAGAQAMLNAKLQFKHFGFMRGRNFNDALVILDEAQNLNCAQIKSFITRIGKGSRVILLGNLSQIDSRSVTSHTSGLTNAITKLRGCDNVGHLYLNGIERSAIAAYAEKYL